MNRAVFLDRDGVLIEDLDILTDATRIRVLPGVGPALAKLHAAGFKLLVVTNQPVVARGLISEAALRELHQELIRRIGAVGGYLDAVYLCPHHPKATLEAYRSDCQCRKPRPGLLIQAAREHGIALPASFMVGDRISDIAAGVKAGCQTILVETGKHLLPPIQSPEPIDPALRAGFACANLEQATDWILQRA